MLAADVFEQLKTSPLLPRHYEDLSKYLAKERSRRERFFKRKTEEQRAEFINGEPVIHSPPTMRHADAVAKSRILIHSYVQTRQLGFVGSSDVLVAFSRNDYMPDIVYFGCAKASSLKPHQRKFPVPDFIAEVLSVETEARDCGVKFEDYANHGVAEYWIVDPLRRNLEQYLLRNGMYELQIRSSSGTVTSSVISGLVLPIAALFKPSAKLRALKTMLEKDRAF